MVSQVRNKNDGIPLGPNNFSTKINAFLEELPQENLFLVNFEIRIFNLEITDGSSWFLRRSISIEMILRWSEKWNLLNPFELSKVHWSTTMRLDKVNVPSVDNDWVQLELQTLKPLDKMIAHMVRWWLTWSLISYRPRAVGLAIRMPLSKWIRCQFSNITGYHFRTKPDLNRLPFDRLHGVYFTDFK